MYFTCRLSLWRDQANACACVGDCYQVYSEIHCFANESSMKKKTWTSQAINSDFIVDDTVMVWCPDDGDCDVDAKYD